RTGRIRTDIEDVGAFFDHSPRMGEREGWRLESSSIGERIGGYVENPHHHGALLRQQLIEWMMRCRGDVLPGTRTVVRAVHARRSALPTSCCQVQRFRTPIAAVPLSS